MVRLSLRLLGGFQARRSSGEVVVLPTRKAEALLAYLGFRPGERHSRARLAPLLWSDFADVQARQSLRQSLAALRRAFGPLRSALVIDGPFVALEAAQVDVDVAKLRRLAAQARRRRSSAPPPCTAAISSQDSTCASRSSRNGSWPSGSGYGTSPSR